MPRKKRTFLLLITSILVSFTPLFTAVSAFAEETAQETTQEETQTTSETFSVRAAAAFSVDVETGKILYNQEGDTPMGIASVTKIISLYLVLNEIKKGNLSWEDTVPISDYVENLSVTPDLSNVPLHQESTYTVRELFEASLIQSANAAVAALAEKIAGSEPEFVDLMRKQLKDWGIKDAQVINSSGLNNAYLGENIYEGSSPTDENELSAKDVAIVARHLIIDFPEVLEVSKITSKMFGEDTQSPVEMVNWNWMLPGFINAKEGVDGLKTGTTDLAGACFVGTMTKEDRRIITVVLNATDHAVNPAARFDETSKLMDYSFDQWTQKEVGKAGAAIPDLTDVAVKDGKVERVKVSLAAPVNMWIRSDMDTSQLTITPKLDKKLVKDNQVEAPLKEGDVIGKAELSLAADTLGYIDNSIKDEADIKVDSTVEKANIFALAWRSVSSFFSNLF
ncbi:D-alanyl-D-alanine carboxypeptidase [Enterococcus sp. JM4C]|uniref:serine hydrolase n=1 Tax=Candidatus Enterococcus huntleyi TaxID=1857217 RepID=UPI00137A0D82|nr:serine hydrolase [Enterococcus sp. JM4C]KAF1295834.1 D-alanyl-D-alanine carboxypeptidase [Enterococcus sp. JM4C]